MCTTSHCSHVLPTLHTHTHTQVTVLIRDINDNNPVIDQSDPINVAVVEHGLNGSIIAIISATDQDSGTNAHIAYSITGGNSASKCF